MTRAGAVLLLLLAALPLRADDALTRAVILPGESVNAAQRLKAARAQRDKGQFSEAIDEYQGLLEEAGDQLVLLSALADPNDKARPVPVHALQARWLCHRDFSRLPAAGLKLYRDRVDGQARKWFEQGAAARDTALLRRVVDEAFCSRVGDRALDLLGDLAFERGRFEEAERWWRVLMPAAAEADRPKGDAGLDLVFPDPQVDVAQVRAKQILARLFRGVPRAAVRDELAAFRKLHDKAEGHLAGRKGNYAATLQTLLDGADQLLGPPEPQPWSTFAGDPSRNLVLPADAHDPNRLDRLARHGPHARFDLEKRAPLPLERDPSFDPFVGRFPRDPDAARAQAYHPVLVGNLVLVADARSVTAYDPLTGKASVWYELAAGAVPVKPVVRPDVRFTLTVAEDCVWARLGGADVGPNKDPDAPARRPADAESYLVCLRLQPDAAGNRLRWVARPDGPKQELPAFEGTPVVRDGRVHIAVTRFAGGRVVTAVHCYAIEPSEKGQPVLRWKQDLCETPEPTGEPRARHHLLTLAGPLVVYASHSGAIVAVDATTGRHAWARRYPSRGPTLPPNRASPRDLAPCVYADGRLYAAPADYDRLLCLDAATGQLLWERDKVEAIQLLGVAGGRLVFTTPTGIRAVSAATGSDKGGWMQPADGSDLAPFGRGFLAGDLVFWPTERGVVVLNAADGEPPDRLIPGSLEKVRRGNLVFGDGCLAVAESGVLSVYLAPALSLPQRERAALEAPQSAVTRYRLALAEADAGRDAEALADLEQTARLAGPGECWDGERLEELARARRYEILLDRAARAQAARRWDDAAADLGRAAAAEHPVPARLEALARLAALWTAAEQPARAATAWQAILDEPALRAGRMDDAQGRPQSAGLLASVQLGRAAPEQPRQPEQRGAAPRAPPALALPLTAAWHVTLAPEERLLVPEAELSPGNDLFCARCADLVCRDAVTGRPCWQQALPHPVAWAGRRADAVLAAGPHGVHRLRRDDGRLLWSFPADPHAPLSDFRLTASHLYFLEGERRLVALDAETGRVAWACWAPAARLRLPSPGGRFFSHYHAGAETVVVQTSGGKLWVHDAGTGRLLHERDTSPEPWPRRPLPLGARNLCLVTDAQTVVLFDPAEGKELGRPRIGLTTTLTGEAPWAAGAAGTLLLLVPRNFGPTLMRLDPVTGKELWPDERSLGFDPVAGESLAFDQDAVYFAAGGAVVALALADGRQRWRVPLPATGAAWRTRVTRDELMVYPADVGARRLQVQGLFGQVGVAALLPVGERMAGGFPVLLCDPKTGRLVQRLNLTAAGPRAEASAGFYPGLSVQVRAAPGAVQFTERGFVVAVEGQAWGRAAAPR